MDPDRSKEPRFLTVETVVAPAVEAGSTRVTPVARTLTLRLGGGVLVRSWPSAVLVEAEGRTSRVPIVNVTRLAQIVIVVVTVPCVCGLVARVARRKGRSS